MVYVLFDTSSYEGVGSMSSVLVQGSLFFSIFDSKILTSTLRKLFFNDSFNSNNVNTQNRLSSENGMEQMKDPYGNVSDLS